MNTASIRRREYSKKEEGIVLPAGYTLGEYWDVTKQVYVPLPNLGTNFDFEVGVIPSNLSSNNGYIILGTNAGHCWRILKGGYICGWDGVSSENIYFTVGEYAVISGHMPTNWSDSATYRYYVNNVDTGIRVNGRAAYSPNFIAPNQYSYGFIGKVYPLKIWRDGKLIKHYVPCTDLQGNGYMYEVVEKEFITPSAGTLVVK